jgi:hypothetical protein
LSRASVKIHPAALEEAEAAMEWYSRRSIRAGGMFFDEANPGQFPEYASGTRKVRLHRFPYLVFFRETPSHVDIIAVVHGLRRPGYW